MHRNLELFLHRTPFFFLLLSNSIYRDLFQLHAHSNFICICRDDFNSVPQLIQFDHNRSEMCSFFCFLSLSLFQILMQLGWLWMRRHISFDTLCDYFLHPSLSIVIGFCCCFSETWTVQSSDTASALPVSCPLKCSTQIITTIFIFVCILIGIRAFSGSPIFYSSSCVCVCVQYNETKLWLFFCQHGFLYALQMCAIIFHHINAHENIQRSHDKRENYWFLILILAFSSEHLK